jgi:hypothetical protein
MLEVILDSLDDQIEDLAADPYDDGLMEDFEDYIERLCFKETKTFRLHTNILMHRVGEKP